jgi:hypothetical protein
MSENSSNPQFKVTPKEDGAVITVNGFDTVITIKPSEKIPIEPPVLIKPSLTVELIKKDLSRARVSGETSGVVANHNILKCYGCAKEDAPEITTENFTCILTDLEHKVREDIGLANFDRALQKYCDDSFFGKRQICYGKSASRK